MIFALITNRGDYKNKKGLSMSTKIVLLRLRESRVGIAHWLMGVVEATSNKQVSLSNGCHIYEILNQQGAINLTFVTDDMITQGSTEFDRDIFASERYVSTSDEVYKGYDRAVQAYQMQRSGLVQPGLAPVPQGARPQGVN